MAIINGTEAKIYAKGVLVAGSTNASLTTSHSTRDATSKDSGGWSYKLEGMREWGLDGELFYNQAAAFGYDELFAYIETRETVSIRLSTETSGEKYFQGLAILVDLGVEAPLEDSMTSSFSFEGTGPLAYIQLT